MRRALLSVLALLFAAGCLQLPPTLESKTVELNALHDQFMRANQLVPETLNNTELWQARLEDFRVETQGQAFEGKEALLEWIGIWLNGNALQRTLLQAFEGFSQLTVLHTDCSKASAPGKVLAQLKQARDQAGALSARADAFEDRFAGTQPRLGSAQQWKAFAESVETASHELEGQIQVNCRTF